MNEEKTEPTIFLCNFQWLYKIRKKERKKDNGLSLSYCRHVAFIIIITIIMIIFIIILKVSLKYTY